MTSTGFAVTLRVTMIDRGLVEVAVFFDVVRCGGIGKKEKGYIQPRALYLARIWPLLFSSC